LPANLRHLRAPALAHWIAEAITESEDEELSGVNLISPVRRREGSEPIRLVCSRAQRPESRAPALRELSRELEGEEPADACG
jgi:hypothetical protein